MTVSCVYVDVNGLHEVNNYLGHSAGDKMLVFVAEVLKDYFNDCHIYRIGGDEFVIFCIGVDESTIIERLYNICKNIEKRKYYISYGVETQMGNGELDIDEIIKAAEKKMYKAKREYYAQNNGEMREKELSQEFEQMLIKKEDAEDFLAVISSNYLGLYFVDLNMHKARALYIPEYFRVIFEEERNDFEKAIFRYIDEFVHEEDKADFKIFAKEKNIKKCVAENNVTEYRYKKTDGSKAKLVLFRSSRYNKEKPESIWLFEKGE